MCANAVLISTSNSVLAANQTWTGGVTNANWSTTNNWVGGAAPGATSGTTNTDIATFNTAIANTWGLVGSPILIDSATQNIGGINFDGAAGNYFIGTTGGNSLKLTSGGTIQILSTLTSTNAVETINAPLVIQTAAGTYTFANNSANGSGAGAGTLNFGGAISGGAAGASVLTLGGSNTNANTISGIISNGTATTMALSKVGTGYWTLTGANTYTGATTIGGGTLKLDFTASGAPSTNIIAAGSALKMNGGTLQIVGASGGSTQTFASTSFTGSTGGQSVISAAPVSGTIPIVNLGTLTGSQGALVRFDGAAYNSGASSGTTLGGTTVAATATYNTTSNTLAGGVITSSTAGSGYNAYATVGLYDWAAVSTGVSGTAQVGSIVGLSQISGGYTVVNTLTTGLFGGNYDLTANAQVGGGSTSISGAIGTIRINTNAALTLTAGRAAGNSVLGAILITPNVGANNTTIALGNGVALQASRATGGATGFTVWQNNTLGELLFNSGYQNGSNSAATGTYTQGGPGTVVMGAVNTYSGQTYLDGGTTVISANSGMGAVATGATVNINGGTLFGNATFSLDNVGLNNRGIFLSGAGGTLAASATNTMTVTGVISGAATAPLTIGMGTIAGTGAGTANTTAVIGSGTVTLTAANSYSGGTTVNAGTLNINGTFALGGANYGGITLNGGKLQYSTAFTGNGSGDLTSIGTAGVTIASGGGTIDTNGNNVTYAGSIGNKGTGALTISDSAATKGTLTLAGANTYTGNTTLALGNLAVTNTTGSATGSGNVAVNGGTLSGNGIITGGVTLAGGTIAPGAAGTNLTVGSLTYNSGTINFSLGASNASSKISETNLTFTAAPSLTFNLSGVTSGEVFTLFNSTNAISGSSFFTSLTPYTIGRLTLTPSMSSNTLLLTASGNPASLTWNNTGASGNGTTWDVQTNQNWSNTGTPDLYFEADNVTFNDSNNGHYAVTLNSTVNPGAVTVNNSSGNYTISGTGAIAGTASLVKNGSSTLTLSTANTYTGGTTINAGTLAVGAVNALPTAGTVTVQGTGTLDLAGNNQTVGNLADGGVSTGTVTSSSGTPTLTVNNSSANAFSGTISGSTGIKMSGTSTLTLSGTNTYTGLTTASSGTLIAASNAAFGSSSSSTGGLLMNPAGTATVDFTSAAPAIASLASSGAGTSSVVLGNGTTPATTTLTVGGGNVSTTFGGVIGDVNATTALGNLALIGTGTLSLTGANTYHGTTTIASGAILSVGNSLALQNSSVDLSNGSLIFGTTTTAATFASLQGSQNLSLSNTNATPAAVALTVGGNNASTTYSGALGGLGALNKNGTGTFTLSGANTYTGATNVNAGTLTITGSLGTSGVFAGAITGNQTGTTLNITNATIYASSLTTNNTGSTANVNISGTSSVTLSGALNINNNNGAGQAGLFLTGGTVNANSVYIGRGGQNYGGGVLAGATGEGLYVNGGALNITNNLNVGGSNSGSTMRIDSGSVTAGGTTTINTTANNRVSLIDVNGGTFTAAGGIQIGGTGTNYGELLMRSGTLNASGITLGASGAGIGVNLLDVFGGTTYIGSGGITLLGSGTPTVNFGSGTVASSPIIGASADWASSLNATLTNSSTATTTTFKAADASSTAHNIALGGVLSGAGGLTKTGAGTLQLTGANTYTGATTISAGILQLGDGTTDGTIASTSGVTDNGTLAYNWAGNHTVGYAISGSGAVTKAGAGTTTFTGANTYAGDTTVSGGTLALSGSGTLGGGTVTASGGTIDLNGTNIFNTLGALTGGGAVNNGTVSNYASDFDVQSGTVGAVLDGTNGLIKTTGSTVTLNAANTYFGATVVNGGTLLVNGSLLNSSAVTVGASGTLGGSGTIASATVINGTLSPGNSPGVMTFGNSLTLNSGSTTLMQVVSGGGTGGATAVAGTDFDKVIVSGAVTFGGTLNIDTTGLTGLVSGDSFHLFSAGSYTTGFTSVVMTGTGSYAIGALGHRGTDWTGSIGSGLSIDFNEANGFLTVTGAIPEPSTYAFFAGLAGLAFVIYRRRRA